MKNYTTKILIMIIFSIFLACPLYASNGIEGIFFPEKIIDNEMKNLNGEDIEIIRNIEKVYFKFLGFEMNFLTSPVIKIYYKKKLSEIVKLLEKYSSVKFIKRGKNSFIWKQFIISRISSNEIILTSISIFEKLKNKEKISISSNNLKNIEKSTILYLSFNFDKKNRKLNVQNKVLKLLLRTGDFKLISSVSGLNIKFPFSNTKKIAKLILTLTKSLNKMSDIIKDSLETGSYSIQNKFLLGKIQKTLKNSMVIPENKSVEINMIYPESLKRLIKQYTELKISEPDKFTNPEILKNKKICVANIKLILIALKLRYLKTKFNGDVKSLNQLIEENYLITEPVCPENGKIYINNTGQELKINCSHHQFN